MASSFLREVYTPYNEIKTQEDKAMKTNIFFRKRREMFIDKSELITVMEILNKHEITYSDLANLKMGNCGWAKAPDCWFIMFSANDRTWYQILREFKARNITLLPETVRY